MSVLSNLSANGRITEEIDKYHLHWELGVLFSCLFSIWPQPFLLLSTSLFDTFILNKHLEPWKIVNRYVVFVLWGLKELVWLAASFMATTCHIADRIETSIFTRRFRKICVSVPVFILVMRECSARTHKYRASFDISANCRLRSTFEFIRLLSTYIQHAIGRCLADSTLLIHHHRRFFLFFFDLFIASPTIAKKSKMKWKKLEFCHSIRPEYSAGRQQKPTSCEDFLYWLLLWEEHSLRPTVDFMNHHIPNFSFIDTEFCAHYSSTMMNWMFIFLWHAFDNESIWNAKLKSQSWHLIDLANEWKRG